MLAEHDVFIVTLVKQLDINSIYGIRSNCPAWWHTIAIASREPFHSSCAK